MAKATTKQGEIKKVGDTPKPEFKGPGVEGKKVVTIITIRDGVAKRILFGEDGKEIGVEDTSPVPEEAKENEKQNPDA